MIEFLLSGVRHVIRCVGSADRTENVRTLWIRGVGFAIRATIPSPCCSWRNWHWLTVQEISRVAPSRLRCLIVGHGDLLARWVRTDWVLQGHRTRVAVNEGMAAHRSRPSVLFTSQPRTDFTDESAIAPLICPLGYGERWSGHAFL